MMIPDWLIGLGIGSLTLFIVAEKMSRAIYKCADRLVELKQSIDNNTFKSSQNATANYILLTEVSQLTKRLERLDEYIKIEFPRSIEE